MSSHHSAVPRWARYRTRSSRAAPSASTGTIEEYRPHTPIAATSAAARGSRAVTARTLSTTADHSAPGSCSATSPGRRDAIPRVSDATRRPSSATSATLALVVPTSMPIVWLIKPDPTGGPRRCTSSDPRIARGPAVKGDRERTPGRVRAPQAEVSVDTDVLVVGAGPTGLMLANQLARRGIRMRIIDRHAGPSRETRALGVQARTLEIYARLGIVARALALGRQSTGANLWAQGRRMARVPLGEAGRSVTPYPFILVLGQDDNERIMGDRLRDQGASVEWNTEL